MNAIPAKFDGPTALKLELSADELVRRLLNLEPGFRLALLDSCGVSVSGGNYLVAGIQPYETIAECGGVVSRQVTGRAEAEVLDQTTLEALDQRLRDAAVTMTGIEWAGGCIATFSYEFGRRFELPRKGKASSNDEPDAELAFFDVLIIHDYSAGESYVAGERPERLGEIRELLNNTSGDRAAAPACVGSITSNFTQTEYETAVRTIKDHIAAGDIYQSNLTQQFTASIGVAAPEDIFLRLRSEHPAPFSAFIRRASDVVISGSPERFVRVTHSNDGRVAEAWPIKGTRPRGTTSDGDAVLRAELLASEKDRAENVMIVDLLRNDLGRVAEFGSVSVEELFTLQEHPSLFHLVSKVRAKLRPDVGMGELFRAAFPCGSITGAPKIRAMEIIDQLEPSPRGLSMGAIGYFGFDGTADLNVAIRTMTIRKGIAKFNVGGGIVADSDPAAEYEESLVKARSLLAALAIEN